MRANIKAQSVDSLLQLMGLLGLVLLLMQLKPGSNSHAFTQQLN